MGRSEYWCPDNGCGKTVYYKGRMKNPLNNNKAESQWKCDKCDFRFVGGRLELIKYIDKNLGRKIKNQ